MKKLLLAVAISSALLSETALAKGKVAGSCAQAVSKASVQTLQGTAIITAIVLLGVWIVSISLNSRRKDRELREMKIGKHQFEVNPHNVKTGIFGRP